MNRVDDTSVYQEGRWLRWQNRDSAPTYHQILSIERSSERQDTVLVAFSGEQSAPPIDAVVCGCGISNAFVQGLHGFERATHPKHLLLEGQYYTFDERVSDETQPFINLSDVWSRLMYFIDVVVVVPDNAIQEWLQRRDDTQQTTVYRIAINASTDVVTEWRGRGWE